MAAVTTPRADPAIAKHQTRRRSRFFHPVRLVLCILPGLVTTAGITAASAVWTPFVRPLSTSPAAPGGGNGTVEYVRAFIIDGQTRRNTIDNWTANHEHVEVAAWGDHLQPWHIRISTPFASRLTWFEKGRVYSRSDVKAPPAASSAAVSCWSFSTACWNRVGSKLTGPLPAPPELTSTNHARTTWATAIEERGWPFRAFTCRLAAPMGSTSDAVYSVTGGVFADGADETTRSGEIQALKVIPTTPMWPGLIADSLLFGLAFYALSFVPLALLRRFRTCRGRCPKCGYNLAGQPSPGCPECGWNRDTSLAQPQPIVTPNDQ